MKTITLNLYTIDELPKEIQQNVIGKYRYINVEDNWWNDYILDEYKEKLESIGFMEPKIFYDVSGRQGSGASFECKYIDNDKMIDHIKSINSKLYRKLNRIKGYIKDYIRYTIQRNSYANHYYHERTRYIDITYSYYGKEHSLIDDLTNTLEKEIESIRLQLCKDLYRDLDKDYSYQTSDEAVLETIQTNEYTFELNGTMRNE